MAATAVAATLLIAACGGGTDDDRGGGVDAALPECPLDALETATGPVEIVVWHSQLAETERTLEALVAEYNDSQDDVEVVLESQGSSYEELVRKFTQAIPTRQLPAALVVDDTSTQFMADSGVVLPAQSCADVDDYALSQFLTTAVDYYTVDGAFYPGSANLGTALTYYNKNHFRRAGLDPDDPPATLDELRAAAEAIQAAGVTTTPMVLSLSPWIIEFWLTGAGAPVVDNGNGRGEGGATAAALADNDTATELLGWIADMQADGLLQALPYAEGGIDQYLALASQNASFTVESSSAATSIAAFLEGDLDLAEVDADADEPTDLSGLDIGAGPFAGIDAGGRGQVGGAAWYMVNTSPPEVQAATWEFMKFLNGNEAQVQLNLGGSYLPFLRSAVDDPRIAAEWSTTLSGRWLATANEMLVDGIDPTFPGPLIGPYTEARLAIREGLEALAVDGRSPQEALQLMQDELDAAFQRYRDEGF
ncbi:extracellular solute-binding protein [Rhabdothermincola salaria]|uniref:extracellular solute-binding protein n=1 Tax=Rhabdothermincola salaria TaxID=2903142 RepID=UPI001E36FE4F|nr:extracellular solute-binding protein [Rhabdothermincola salaria]